MGDHVACKRMIFRKEKLTKMVRRVQYKVSSLKKFMIEKYKLTDYSPLSSRLKPEE